MSSSDRLRISLWDEPRLRILGEALAGPETEVSFVSRAEGEKRLLAGLVDAALLPTNRAVVALDNFDVVPAVAYSGWSTPHARVALRGGFEGRPEELACREPDSLEALVARIVLQEHYGIGVAPVALEKGAAFAREAVLVLDGALPHSEGVVLDLGEEWYELTNYPMVWGLFATRKGEVDATLIRVLRAAASSIETADDLDGTDPGADGLGLPRFRFDDIATASLTELCSFLYYYGITGDIFEVKPAEVSEKADIGFDGREPLL